MEEESEREREQTISKEGEEGEQREGLL